MTISTNNLLSISPVSQGVSLESLQSGQENVLPVNLAESEQEILEGNFWTMLNQQLTEIIPNEGLQSIESKDLLPLYDGNGSVPVSGEFEFTFTDGLNSDAVLEQDVPDVEENSVASWQYNVYQLISDSENSLSQTEIDIDDLSLTNNTDIIEPLTEPAVPVAGISLSVLEQNNIHLHGDKLPQSRQLFATIQPQLSAIASDEVQTNNDNPVVSVEGDEINFELLSTLKEEMQPVMGKAGLSVGTEEAVDIEKLQMKQIATDQTVIPTTKDNNSPTSQFLLNPVSAINLPAHSSSAQNPAVQTLQLTPQATASQWGEAVGEKISLFLNNKLNSAEIRLDPPHLGKLDIHIQLKDDSATVMITTQHAQTRDMIESASVRLKEFLQEAGYNSVDVDVSQRDQSMAQGDLNQHENEAQNESSDEQLLPSQPELSGNQLSELLMQVDEGRIDYFA